MKHTPRIVAGNYRDGMWECSCGMKAWIVAIRFADFKGTVGSLDLVSDCGTRWRNFTPPKGEDIPWDSETVAYNQPKGGAR